MMKRLVSCTLLLAFVGCSGGSMDSGSAAQTTLEKPTTLVVDSASQSTDDTADQSYPENAEVMRLLVRANSLESKGEFEDALALADQAVAIDPNSPKANALKARLQELLRRV